MHRRDRGPHHHRELKMTERCQHWREHDHPDHGLCALARFGGKPSLGTCRNCPENTAAGKWPNADSLPAAPPPGSPATAIPVQPCGGCGKGPDLVAMAKDPKAVDAWLAGE